MKGFVEVYELGGLLSGKGFISGVFSNSLIKDFVLSRIVAKAYRSSLALTVTFILSDSFYF